QAVDSVARAQQTQVPQDTPGRRPRALDRAPYAADPALTRLESVRASPQAFLVPECGDLSLIRDIELVLVQVGVKNATEVPVMTPEEVAGLSDRFARRHWRWVNLAVQVVEEDEGE